MTDIPVVMVTGARTWRRLDLVHVALDDMLHTWGPFVLRHGDCPLGADRMARNWAVLRAVLEDRMPADWDRHGSAAGFLRNEAMVDKQPKAVACLAFVDDCQKASCKQTPKPHMSHGTRHCAEYAHSQGITVIPYINPGSSLRWILPS